MNDLTDKLKNLGFSKIHVSAEESGNDPFDYFVLEIGDICLISNGSDEWDFDGVIVNLFDSSKFAWLIPENLELLESFILSLKSVQIS